MAADLPQQRAVSPADDLSLRGSFEHQNRSRERQYFNLSLGLIMISVATCEEIKSVYKVLAVTVGTQKP